MKKQKINFILILLTIFISFSTITEASTRAIFPDPKKLYAQPVNVKPNISNNINYNENIDYTFDKNDNLDEKQNTLSNLNEKYKNQSTNNWFKHLYLIFISSLVIILLIITIIRK